MVLKPSQELQRRIGVLGKEGLGTGLDLHGVGTFSRQGGGVSSVNEQSRAKILVFFYFQSTFKIQEKGQDEGGWM